MNWPEIKLIFIVTGILIIPGWAILSVTQIWKRWPVLQRWIVAFGLSVCFYPVLFYISRWLAPGLHLGSRKNVFILASLGLLVLYMQRKDWKEQFRFENLEWIVLFIFAITIFTRLWTAHLQPYPAWSDSLHHTILTQIVAQNGQLPFSLAPYEPSILQMYHLGLYAITGVVQQIANVPATTALLWTSQYLNGLAGVGTYLVLDRLSGRKGALVGALVVGFFSFQPAWYVNWGRFTQIASQSVMLIAWTATNEAVIYWGQSKNLREKAFLAFIAALLCSGTFLIHFRVAGLLIPLLVVSLSWILFHAIRIKRLQVVLSGIAIIGVISLFLISSAIWSTLQAYINGMSALMTDQSQISILPYYNYPLSAYFTLGEQPWIYGVALLSVVFAGIHRSKLTIGMLLWVLGLWIIGNAYRLQLFWLSFVNYTGIMIMFYLPISIVIGDGFEILISKYHFFQHKSVLRIGLEILLFFSIVFSFIRVNSIETYRYFLTSADINAMNWINKNIPKDAVFAINTYMWMGTIPQGVDGGYWIPYFTQRRTTTGTMMFTSAPKDYANQILSWSKFVINLGKGQQYAKSLCSEGVDYAYIGSGGWYSSQRFSAEQLFYPETRVLYQENGVTIMSICAK